MHGFKYEIKGSKLNPADEDLTSRTFCIGFGKIVDDEAAKVKADDIFKNELLAAKPGELVEMVLYESGRVVKPYPMTRKEAPIDPVDRLRAENMELQVLSQIEEIAAIAEADGITADQE